MIPFDPTDDVAAPGKILSQHHLHPMLRLGGEMKRPPLHKDRVTDRQRRLWLPVDAPEPSRIRFRTRPHAANRRRRFSSLFVLHPMHAFPSHWLRSVYQTVRIAISITSICPATTSCSGKRFNLKKNFWFLICVLFGLVFFFLFDLNETRMESFLKVCRSQVLGQVGLNRNLVYSLHCTALSVNFKIDQVGSADRRCLH